MIQQLTPNKTLISPCHIPQPVKDYVNHRVVIYSFSDNYWVPIKYCYLLKAIELYHRIRNETGKEVFLFPPDLDPNKFWSTINQVA